MSTPRNLSNGQLVIKDGTTPTPNSLTVAIEVGDLTVSVKSAEKEIHDRADLIAFTRGKDVPMDVSFTIAYVAYFGDASANETTPVDAITFEGGASGWKSTQDGDVKSVDLHFQMASPDTSKSELIILPNFHKEEIKVTEGEDFTKISVTGKCMATKPTVSRVTSFS